VSEKLPAIQLVYSLPDYCAEQPDPQRTVMIGKYIIPNADSPKQRPFVLACRYFGRQERIARELSK